MISLLLIFSFLLHTLILIAIYKLFQQLENLKETKNDDIETLLNEFMQEIKTENEELEQLFQSQKQSTSTEESLEQTSVARNDNIMPSLQQSKQDDSTYDISSLLHQHSEISDVSEEGKALQLAAEGYTVDEIAKRLNKGVTEVALIIKLQQQFKQNT